MNTTGGSEYDSETPFAYPRKFLASPQGVQLQVTVDPESISARMRSRLAQPAPLASCVHFLMMGFFVDAFMDLAMLAGYERMTAQRSGCDFPFILLPLLSRPMAIWLLM